MCENKDEKVIAQAGILSHVPNIPHSLTASLGFRRFDIQIIILDNMVERNRPPTLDNRIAIAVFGHFNRDNTGSFAQHQIMRF